MAFGTITVGRIALREDSVVDLSNGQLGRQLALVGQESMPRVSLDQLKQREEDILGLEGRFLPVLFSQKSELDGYYWITGVSASYDKWMPDNIGVMPWSLNLARAGRAGNLDLESRLSGPQTRVNDHSGVGVRWSAPSIGHKAFSAGSTMPNVTSRTSTEGSVVVYRDIALAENPKWGSTPTEYLQGRCRIIDAGLERVSEAAPLSASGWELNNGLVRVKYTGTSLDFSAWTGGAWQSKLYDVWYNIPSESMGFPDYTTIVRNDFEMVSIRLTKSLVPGRVIVDISLRRGSRFAEIYIQHQFGTTLKIIRNTDEVSTTNTGFIVASAADAQGNKFVLGSAKSFIAVNVSGGIAKEATSTLDAFIGVEIASAPAGDTALDLFKQYLGAPIETVQGVSR